MFSEQPNRNARKNERARAQEAKTTAASAEGKKFSDALEIVKKFPATNDMFPQRPQAAWQAYR